MVPAQDEKRQVGSVTAVADEWELARNARVIESVAVLGSQLDALEIDSIDRADSQLQRIAAHLQYLDGLLQTINTIRECRSQIDLVKSEHDQNLEDVKTGIRGQSAGIRPLPRLANLVELRSVDILPAPANQLDVRVGLPTPQAAPQESPFSDSNSTVRDDLRTDGDDATKSINHDETVSARILTRVGGLSVDATFDQDSEREPNQVAANISGIVNAQSVATILSDRDGKTQLSTGEQADETKDFDAKLLDDLIKNYGEFAANPNLPAAAQESSTLVEFVSKKKPSTPALDIFNAPSQIDGFTRNSHDSDNKGRQPVRGREYDTQFERAALKTKMRVGGAFLVLAVFLGGIYYLAAPRTASSPTTSTVRQHPADKTQRDSDVSNSSGINSLPATGVNGGRSEASRPLKTRKN